MEGKLQKANCKKCGPVKTSTGRCPTCAKFCKGFSGNKGNKKANSTTSLIPEEARKEIGDDPFNALKWLLKNAENKTQLRQVANDMIKFVKPQLSSIKTETVQDTNITIEWVDATDKNYIDVSDYHKKDNNKNVKDLEDKSKESEKVTQYTEALKEAEEILKDTKK